MNHQVGCSSILAAVATSTFVSPSLADITYVSLATPVVFRGTPTPHLDLNGDGVDDLGFYAIEGWPSDYHFCSHTVYAINGGPGGVTNGHFGPGTLIGPGTVFTNSFQASYAQHTHTTPDGGPLTSVSWGATSPRDGTPVYFGFRISDATGTYYGWGRYQLFDIRGDLIHSAQLLDYAYETTPGVPIVAGHIGCSTSDFNGDGASGQDDDIEAFFLCLGGHCCATCWVGGSDFNGDGAHGQDDDIEAFFMVLGGAAC